MLLVVLWAMGLVSLAVGALVVRATHELRLGSVPLELVQAEAIAQAGVYQAIRVIQQDTQEAPQYDALQEPWASGLDANGVALFERIVVGTGIFSVGHLQDGVIVSGLIDEGRKLNLNTATPSQLQQLITSVNSDGSIKPVDVAAAIIDWRDAPQGAWCDAQQLGYPCHNGLLDSVEELRLVPGMTPGLFAALEPFVTVYGPGAINANTAEPAVLKAMGLSDAQISTIVQQRRTQPFDAGHPPPAGLAVTSSAFSFSVEARTATGRGLAHLRAVIDRAGCSPNAPPEKRCILAWSPNW